MSTQSCNHHTEEEVAPRKTLPVAVSALRFHGLWEDEMLLVCGPAGSELVAFRV